MMFTRHRPLLPYCLAPLVSLPTASLPLSQRYEVQVQPGDIVVLGTDGLWDNCFNEEILSVLKYCMQVTSGWLTISITMSLNHMVHGISMRGGVIEGSWPRPPPTHTFTKLTTLLLLAGEHARG